LVIVIDFDAVVQDSIVTGVNAGPVSGALFGGVSITTQDDVVGSINYKSVVSGTSYSDHFTAVYDNLSLNFLRYPGGELPDGFLVDQGGEWNFKHNNINGGSGVVNDPETGAPLAVGDITQTYLDSLTPAFSLTNPELLDDRLLGDGRMSFSDSLQLAYESGSSYSLVLPEFQYLKIPVDRDPDGDGVKTLFVASEHVKLATLEADVYGFLENLFVNGAYNNGDIPDDFILEIGNEDFYGWNTLYFPTDSYKDLDSYSAYAFGCLEAIKSFRIDYPDVDFKVSLQAGGANYVREMQRNFTQQQASDLFGQVDVISVVHDALDVTLDDAAGLEHLQYTKDGIHLLQGLIDAAGGDSSATQIIMSEWSAVSGGGTGLDGVNHALPAASATISLFSSMIEMGIDYSANWGISGWGGFGTNATSLDANGNIKYAPVAEAYRLMAESLTGTTQIDTGLMDVGRDADFGVFAYEDNAKAVLFLAANDYIGTETIDLSNFGSVAYAWVERITTTGNATDGFVTVVTREMVSYTAGSVTVTINNPYEVVRILVAKENPGDGYLHLWGGEGTETLTGGLSADLLEGNGGDDILIGGLGDDTLDGGAGIDCADYSDASGGVQAYLTMGSVTGVTGTDVLINMENLTGSAFDDRLVGDAGVNILRGGAGNDILKTKGGDDTVYGETGNDTITGDTGNETLWGGDGDDILSGLSGTDYLSGGAGADYLYGGQGTDTLDGGAGNDKLRGNLGGDLLNGGDGNDDLRGGGGNDVLNGGDGADYLIGENGEDVLYGGAGNDVLNGGGGDGFADTFVYKNTASEGYDRVKDFENGIDRIDLSDFAFAGFADVGAVATQINSGIKLNFGNGNVLLLEGMVLADFDAGDVIL